MIDPERLRRQFEAQYGQMPRLFSAPGRVNLIGEHTDYINARRTVNGTDHAFEVAANAELFEAALKAA